MVTPTKQSDDAAIREPLIRIRGLSTALNGKTIFDGVDLDIPRGRVTAVMGPSGTGKTTLMRHITGQLAPDAGEIVVAGQNVWKLGREALFELREKIGYLFQNSALLTDFSVFENVAFPLRQHLKLPEELVRNIVLTKLQAVGLRGAAELMPNELSGGMIRRVALARAIVRDPMLIIYDEPFVGLDPIALNQIVKLIRTLNETLGVTAILVAHEFSAVRRVADHIHLLAGGTIAAYGTPDELAQGATPWTRQFFSGEADGPVPFHYPAPDYAKQLGLSA
jgi:phospholipid/cholesterol/gamma-HCH transport system ATP-binding protein